MKSLIKSFKSFLFTFKNKATKRNEKMTYLNQKFLLSEMAKLSL